MMHRTMISKQVDCRQILVVKLVILLQYSCRSRPQSSSHTVTTSPECVICLEEFREGQECRLLATCNHSYHKSCTDQWLAVTESNCPLCRAPAQNVS
ncbi:hypothetical protein Pyn_21926 [Prunus yedoensis var. nudiflora]|uniref:RING-type domain-containing protein n=1 Tax=Prunus yedoensis var. nudiflora TaxID=2094558 RepID=A0A314XRM2_PRUYE|nr:hypothetical protein Pyn_21926 [Prunus yedoensis var. nudiflora]